MDDSETLREILACVRRIADALEAEYAPSDLSADPAALVESLDVDAIRREVARASAERDALLALLRVAQRAARGNDR